MQQQFPKTFQEAVGVRPIPGMAEVCLDWQKVPQVSVSASPSGVSIVSRIRTQPVRRLTLDDLERALLIAKKDASNPTMAMRIDRILESVRMAKIRSDIVQQAGCVLGEVLRNVIGV